MELGQLWFGWSVVEPEMYLLGLWPVTLNADQAPAPLTVFISGSGFDRGLGCFGLGCARPIVGRFCTRRDRYTVVACARFRCDRWGTCWAGARQILVGFRVWSGYRWWVRRQSCEICTCTLILMTKNLLIFCFVLNLCCSLVVLCHVMLAINCTELNWIELSSLVQKWAIYRVGIFWVVNACCNTQHHCPGFVPSNQTRLPKLNITSLVYLSGNGLVT